jgi:tetratricopeptide (TPR) repeat protein
VIARDAALAAAQASLARTIALTPNAPLARVADATVKAALFEFQQAAAILEDVVAHDPQNVFAQQQYVHILGCLGRMSDALAVVERIRRIDPLNPFASISREYVLMNLHRFQESADAALRDLELNPMNWISLRNVSVDFVFLGKPDSAVRIMEAAWRVDAISSRLNLAFAYAAAGRWADVDRLETAGKRLPPGNSPDYFAAVFDVIDGRYDSAMRHVEQGVAAREPMFATAWFSCDLGLDVLRKNPRFAAVAASVGARTCPPVERWPLPARKQR